MAIPIAGALAGVAVAWQRYHTTDEQLELGRYVEMQVPSLLDMERAVYQRIDRLSTAPGPSPAEARALLVDDVMPRLIALRTKARSVEAHTPALRAIDDEYLATVDKLIEACRAAVRAIDDPSLSSEAGEELVRRKFYEAGTASKAWSQHLREACVKAKLTPPG